MEQNNIEIVDGKVQAAHLLSIDGNDPLEEIKDALAHADGEVNEGVEIEDVEMPAARLLCRIEDAIVECHQTRVDDDKQRKSLVESFREVAPSRIASETPGTRAIRRLQEEMPWSDLSYSLHLSEVEVE